ncbi:MAG: hypothetical protein COA58_09400 [Bacteroidetes bacterium]|nr:MAG: hypothetical protein COA58_09400 [Bacteroidota bacterium]
MPLNFKKLFANLEKEDFSYSKTIARPKCFADDMCHNFHKIQDLIMYLQSEWEAAKSMDENISTYAIDRKDSAGIVIKVGEQSNLDLHHYLIDYIKSQLENDNYIVQANKHTSQRVSGACEESWFYFLKPKPSFEDKKHAQRYGNVIIELKKDCKNAVQFKLQCNYYSGFNYQNPIDFGNLLSVL